MPIERSTVAGVAGGVLLLAGVVGFGVGLPEVIEGEAGHAASAELPKLPDALSDDVKALSAVTPEDAKAQTEEDREQIEAFTQQVEKSDAEAASHLASLYDDATVRSYVSLASMDPEKSSGLKTLGVSVVPGEAGMVIPRGPFEIEGQGAHYKLQKIDGHQCAVSWSEQIDPATGQPAEGQDSSASYQVECRADRDGLAYSVFGNGFDEKQIAGFLDELLARTE
jgi:hypothetical protein